MADPTDPTRADRPVGVAEARRRAVIDAAVDGIIVIDARGRIEVSIERRRECSTTRRAT